MTFRRRSLLLAISVVSLVTFGILLGGSERPPRTPLILEIDMRTSAGTAAQLYWSTDLNFVDHRTILLPIRAGEDFQRLRFPLPSKGFKWLRFDPTNASGEVSIRAMQVVSPDRGIIETVNPERLHPYQHVASMARDGDVTRLLTMPGATDASLLVSLSSVDRTIADRMALATPASLALVTAAVLMLLIACLVVILRAAFAGVPGDSVQLFRWQPILWMGALFLIVFSAHLLFMRQNPVTAPFWDQWDIEASSLYVPYHEKGLSWRSMFSLANEHRVFFTRLLALDLLIFNGQWEPRLQQVVNAGIHALTAVLLVAALYIASHRRRIDLLVFIVALSFAPPFAWENILSAIQSAAYLLVLFSVLSLALVTLNPPHSGAWLLGWACALCALFTFANGILVPLAIMGTLFLKWVDSPSEWRELTLNAAAVALVLGLGIATAAPSQAHHATFHAASLTAFASALGHNLSWPWITQQWLSVVLWLPVVALLAAAFWHGGRTTELERFIVGLAIWVVLNAAILAYGRGGTGAVPATRYLDYLSLGFVANTMALVAALERLRAGRVARGALIAVLAGWLVSVSAGVDQLVRQTLDAAPAWRQYFANHAASVRRLMVTHDYAQFLALPPLAQLPYPDSSRLTTLLQDPYIQQILPPSVRSSLGVEARVSTNDAFVLQLPQLGVPYDPLARAWWSLSDQGRKAEGRFESQPIACHTGTRLKFQVSGYLGWQNQYLAIEEHSTGRRHVVQPSRLAREGWEDVVLPCPPGPIAIIAVDEATDSWFGFREPIEVGRTFVLIEWLIENSRPMLFGSFALAALALRWTNVKSDRVRSAPSLQR
jgi:hypothetical protein